MSAGPPAIPAKPPDSLQHASPPPPPPPVAVIEISVTPAGIVQVNLPGWLKLHWPWDGAGVGVDSGDGVGSGGVAVGWAVGVGVEVGLRASVAVAVGLAVGFGAGEPGTRDAEVTVRSPPPQARHVSGSEATRKRRKPPAMLLVLQYGRQPPTRTFCG